MVHARRREGSLEERPADTASLGFGEGEELGQLTRVTPPDGTGVAHQLPVQLRAPRQVRGGLQMLEQGPPLEPLGLVMLLPWPALALAAEQVGE